MMITGISTTKATITFASKIKIRIIDEGFPDSEAVLSMMITGNIDVGL